ncbi:hypothetical protein RYH80_10230 [Halobaculum sp. MBLA0147]|uniref:hypothetical protein n=1 Tax=Halobaculum sp. MBLA0147 TaxID=3079934 RepID=UPI0035248BD3
MSDTAQGVDPRRPEWSRRVDELLDEAVDREEDLVCSFDDVWVEVPLRTGGGAPTAEWGLSGSVEITVEGQRGPLADWLRWWHGRTDGE